VAAAKSDASATSKPEPAAATQDAGKRGLKDPKTGDIATNYNNYRLTKRWIKEALVAEGLLDKIYKNDALTAEVEAIRGNRTMPIWNNCTMMTLYYSDEASDDDPCIVRIDERGILVGYECEGTVQYTGTSNGERRSL
jgi:hypothetical protein